MILVHEPKKAFYKKVRPRGRWGADASKSARHDRLLATQRASLSFPPISISLSLSAVPLRAVPGGIVAGGRPPRALQR